MSDARGRAFADRLGPAAAPVTVLAIATTAWLLDHGTPDRQRAILFAAAVCLTGGLASWLAALRPATTPAMRVASGLATIALRLLPALAGLAWLQTSGAALRAAGGSELLVIMYLAALAADLVRIIVGTRRGGRSPGDRGVI